jgi:hypothetical protein
MLSFVLLNIVMLSAIMLSVVAPIFICFNGKNSTSSLYHKTIFLVRLGKNKLERFSTTTLFRLVQYLQIRLG